MPSMPKLIKGLAKYSNEMTKSGMLTVGDFYKNHQFVENIACEGREATTGNTSVLRRLEKRRPENTSALRRPSKIATLARSNNNNNNIIIIIYNIYRALIPNGPKALYMIKITTKS